MTYVDSSGEDEPFSRYGFLLEDDDIMATRNGGGKLDWDIENDFSPTALRKDLAILLDVFQYMIGNTDWSGVRMHNVELVHRPPTTYVTIPYDFDFSGIVNARYASPDASLPIRTVRERLFRGICPEQVGREPSEYDAIYAEFRQKKEEIYELWRNQEGLEEGRIEDKLEYLDDFFEILDDPKKIKSEMLDKCRRMGGP